MGCSLDFPNGNFAAEASWSFSCMLIVLAVIKIVWHIFAGFCSYLEEKQSGSPVTDHQRSFEGKTRVSFSGESTGGWSKVRMEGHQVASQGSSGGKGWRARCNHLHHGH